MRVFTCVAARFSCTAVLAKALQIGKQEKNEPATFPAPYAISSYRNRFWFNTLACIQSQTCRNSDEHLSSRDRIPSIVVSTLHYNEWRNISGLFSLIIFSLYTKVPTITDFHNKCTWLGSTVYPRFFANITDTEMFVAKITTAITKASGKMFDIMEREGTLKGGSLEMKVEMSVKIQ